MKIEKFSPDLVVADFDGTITQKLIEGTVVPSLISILRDYGLLDEDYSARAKELYNYYSKFEIDPNLSNEEKFEKMKEWWTKHYELLKEKKLKLKDIEKAVNHEMIQVRKWFKEFLEELNNKKIPLIILSSSGLGEDSIRMTFEKFNLPLDNVVIISNKLNFNENGEFTGVDENSLIHWMNKRLKDHLNRISDIIKGKNNVLLLGDNLHDTEMLEGMDFEKVLKIGFFLPKHDKDKERKSWEKVYDVILPADASFDEVMNYLKLD